MLNTSVEPTASGGRSPFRYASRMNTPTVDTSLLVRAPRSAACAEFGAVRSSSTAVGGANLGAPSGARRPSHAGRGCAPSGASFLAMQSAGPPSSVRTPVGVVEQASPLGASSRSIAEHPSLGLCITRRWNGPGECRVGAARSIRWQPAVQRKR